MKTKFGSLVMLALLTLFAVIPAWAETRTLEGNATTGYYIDMPASGTDNLTIPDGVTMFKVYDDGGKMGTYSCYIDGYLEVTAPEGFVLQVTGSLIGYDYVDLFIYDGNSEAQEIGAYGPTTNWYSPGTVDVMNVSSGNTLTIRLYNSCGEYTTSYVAAGLDLTVKLVDPNALYAITLNPTSGGTVTKDLETAMQGEFVTLTATPNEGFLLARFNVEDADGRSVPVEGGNFLTENMAEFEMPASDVFVTPVFKNTLSASDGLSINMPSQGTRSVTIPAGVTSFKLYDDGGPNGYYTDDADGTLILTASEGYLMQVSGYLDVDDYNVLMSIYDGDVNSEKLFDFSGGEISNLGTIVSTGNVLTVTFHSEDWAYDDGFALTVTVIPGYSISAAPVQGGTVDAGKEFVTAGSTVTLTATPDEGYVLEGIVAYANGNAVNVDYTKWDNTATFVMPAGAVTVTPTFTSASGLSLNMPVSGTQNIVIPDGVTSIKVYDDGGSTANYSNNAKGYLQLTAPEGRILQVTGSIVTEGSGTDFLTIYDGAAGSTKLLNALASGSNGATANVGTVFSSGRTATIYFKSDNTVNYAGLDLTVTVVDATTPHTVAITSVEGGSVSSDVSSAPIGNVVTLTATPSSGYTLAGISVVNDDLGTAVVVTGGLWYSGNTASFVMPASSVTVTPIFSNDLTAEGGLFINMPANGEFVGYIPDGVVSFAVYDDGGKDGNYSNNANGLLKMIAPPKIRLEATIRDSALANKDSYVICKANYCDPLSINVADGYNGEGDTLVVSFQSNEMMTERGFDIKASIVSPYNVTVMSAEGGVVTSDAYMPRNAEVSLGIVANEGYYFKGASVVDESTGESLEVRTLSSFENAATFTMPASNVTVTPVFTNVLTAPGGIYINMPVSGSKSITIPEGVTSFKVYDDGGKDYTYTSKAIGTLDLTVPEGYVMQVMGTVDANSYNSGSSSNSGLSIYDGHENAPVLLSDFRGEKKNNNIDMGMITSTGNTLRLVFIAGDYTSSYSGLDLTVTVFERSASHSVTVAADIEGGSASVDKSTAGLDEIVTVTTTPNSGYLLTDIDVIDESGNKLNVENGSWWNGPNATFVMPGSNVTVIPHFTNELTAQNGLYINMPVTGTASVSVPSTVKSFKLYDDGGMDCNHSATTDGFLAFTAPEGYVFQVTGTMKASPYNAYARLNIYDGLEASSPAILSEFRTTSPDTARSVGIVVSTGNLLMVNFRTSNGGRNEGLDLTVALKKISAPYQVSVNAVAGGTVDPDKGEALYGDTVTLTPNPQQGYLLSEIDITDSEGNDVEMVNFASFGTEIKFVMPYSNVSITPRFTNDLTADGGLYITMPVTGTTPVSIPSGVTSFKVYDDGKDDVMRSNAADGYLELTAPEGYVLQVRGTMSMNRWSDTLTIYDGAVATQNILAELANKITNDTMNIGKWNSTGRVLTLALKHNSANNYMGIDLTVSVINATDEHLITLNDAAGGSLSKSVTTAPFNTIVTLTATPDASYVFKGVSVVDSEGNSIIVDGGTWYSNSTASFVMPASNVDVTPEFSSDLNGLYINMPASGTKSGVVPANVTSFKVYDDGGKSGKHSETANGYLELTAPAGHIFVVTGTVTTYEESLYSDRLLTIYDGIESSNTLLSYFGSTNRGTARNIGRVATSGNTIKLHFDVGSVNSGYCYDGLDLTVDVVDASETYAIAYNDAEGGSVTGDQVTAAVGETVRLTASPDANNLLSGVNVAGANYTVEVSGGKWYSSDTASFIMPNFDVTVTPTFTTNMTNLFVNMPEKGTISGVVPAGVTSFKVYDNGGASSNYSVGTDGFLELTAPEGSVMIVTGSIKAYRNGKNGAYLTIYDGLESSTELLSDFRSNSSGTLTDIGFLVTSSNAVKFHFYDLGNYSSGAGLDLTVTVVDPSVGHSVTVSQVDGGTLSSSMESVAVGTKVTLSATPAEGYVFTGVTVLDGNNNAVAVTGGTWISDNKVSFVMPYSDVTVTPVFSNDLTNFSINMPKSGTVSAIVPASVTSFKVYDDGGSSANYYSGADGYLELIAPEGFLLQIAGSLTTYSVSYNFMSGVTIYDGIESTNTLVSEFGSEYSCSARSLTPLTTSGNSMRIYFVSGSSSTCSGLDFTVTLVPLSEAHAVTVSDATGFMASDKSEALVGNTVTLTATPDDGYVLTDLFITDCNGKDVAYSGGWPTDEITFSMPNCAVTVSPTFTDGGIPYVRIPAVGTRTVQIPAGAVFNIYDDGGASRNYSLGASGYLKLILPENQVLQMAGTITTAQNAVWLSIFDGDTTSKILNKKGRPASGSSRDIGVVTSSGNEVDLFFRTNSTSPSSGLALLATAVNKSSAHNVTVEDQGVHGTITTVESATAGSLVTLTATPNTGYLLAGVSVVDAAGNTVAVNDNWLGDSTATFTMPGSDVTITPVFTDDLTTEGGLYVNMPVTGTKVVNIPVGVTSFNLYDDGGKDDFYTLGTDGRLELVAPENCQLMVTGTITGGINTAINIYRDRETSQTYLYNFSSSSTGVSTDIGLIISAGNSLAINFKSTDPSNFNKGLDLKVEVLDPSNMPTITLNQVEHGLVECDKTAAMAGTAISLTATPNEGYVLSHVDVLADGNSMEYTGGTFYDNTVAFTMPNKNVAVTPVYVEHLTADDGAYINMPSSGTKNIVIPEGVTSFKLYDDGGKDGLYTKKVSSCLAMTAPQDSVIMVSGTMKVARQNSTVTIYGGSAEAQTVLWKQVGDGYGTLTTFRPTASNDNWMKLCFSNSTNDGPYDGLDFTVTLSASHTITIADVEGGSIASNYEHAPTGQQVSLFATPGDQTVLSGINVSDAEDNVIDVENVSWYGDTATFTMPASDVTVTPVFSRPEGLFVNMVPSKTLPVIIPASVRTFKLYDDGGSAGPSSSTNSGYFLLTAPEGSVLRVSGSVSTSVSDYMRIYDGSTASTSIRILSDFGSESNGVARELEPLVSSGNKMLIHFYSRYSSYDGFDLTVEVLSPRTVTVADAENGTETYDNLELVMPGTSVAVLLNADPGYFVSTVSVVDLAGNTVAFTEGTTSSGTTIVFEMPNDDVIVTPFFATPTVVTFDENGCLNNGMYFHMECDESSQACMLSQKVVDEPDVGVTDFKCWSALAAAFNSSYSLGLEQDLDLGGYNSATGKCAMQNFVPLQLSGTMFNGMGKTVKGFCYIDNTGDATDGSFGFVNGVANVSYVTFDSAHVVVNSAATDDAVGVVAGETTTDDVSINYVTVENSYVAGTQVVGGIVGKIGAPSSNVDFMRSSFDGSVSFANTSSPSSKRMGPLFGYAEATTLNVVGNSSKGNISYTGVDATVASIGYLGGSYTATNVLIYGNFHYGADAVATGFGNIDATTWKAGSDAYFANVRNAVDGLADDGKMGMFLYEVDGNDLTDMFAANFSDNTMTRVRNGVAREADMKSGMLAAAMNYLPQWTISSSEYVWTWSANVNDDLPVAAMPNENTSYLLAVLLYDQSGTILSQFTNNEKNAWGLHPMNIDVDLENGNATLLEGIVGYTDASGHANAALVDSLQAIMQALENKGYAPYLQEEDLGMFTLTENTVFVKPAEGILIQTRAKQTFTVAYQYCTGLEADEQCVDMTNSAALAAFTDLSFVFTSPVVSDVSNSESFFAKLVPNAIALGENGGPLFVTVSRLNGTGTEIDRTETTGFMTFLEAIGDGEDVAQIVVKYNLQSSSPGGTFPEMTVQNPEHVDYTFNMYAYNMAGEKELYMTQNASPDNDLTSAYGASFAVDANTFPDRVGYTHESYAVAFTVTNPNERLCNDIVSVDTVNSESKDIAPWEELSVTLNNCTSKTWTVAGLKAGDSVGLENVKIARSIRTNEIANGNWSESFAVIPEYTPIDYEVTFDISSLQDSIVALGKSALDISENATKTMNLSDDARNFPKVYVFTGTSYFNEVYWSNLLKANNDLDGAYPELQPELIEAVLSDNAEANAMTLLPAPVLTLPNGGDVRGYNTIDIMLYDGDGNMEFPEADDYHGHVVLAQTWNGLTFKQRSIYGNSSDMTVLELKIPYDFDDTLEYQVLMEPDPGYRMELIGDNTGYPLGGDWGYNSTMQTLKLPPRQGAWMNVKYTPLHYNVTFSVPEDADVYVANMMDGEVIAMNWFASADNLSAEGPNVPSLYNSNGCIVGWKPSGSTVENRADGGIAEAFAYMISIEDGSTEPIALVPDVDNPLCPDQNVGDDVTYTQTLQVEEGQGTVALVQNLGQTQVKHSFNDAGVLTVPAVFANDDEEVGVTVAAVATPAPGYMLKQLSYDMTIDDQTIAVLVQENSTEVNVMDNITWHARFIANGPAYVAYDLSLDEGDSSNVWIPADAVDKGSVQIASDGTPVELWKPYRSDMCFAGWSTSPAGASTAFTSVTLDNFGLFSSDVNNPTQLYAVWRAYGNNCNRPDLSEIQSIENYDILDTLVVTQKLGDATFIHKSTGTRSGSYNWTNNLVTYLSGDPMQFAYNPAGYNVFVDYIFAQGYEPEEDADPVYVKINNSIISPNAETGALALMADANNKYYSVALNKRQTVYKVVLSANAGEHPVLYGENWSSSAVLRYKEELPPGSVFRLDACFSGWSFDPAEAANYNFDMNNRLEKFGDNLMQQMNDRIAAGLSVDTLYAKWDEYASCREGILTLSLDREIRDLATVTLYQEVDGIEVKAFEIGSKSIEIPVGATYPRYLTANTSYTSDNIYFTRAEITPKPGLSLGATSQLTYINLSDEEEIPHEVVHSGTTIDDDVVFRLEGMTKNTYSVAYHENAGDANVFYGENWTANATFNVGDTLNTSLYRTDSCFAGWAFGTSGNGYVFNTVDADFIAEYDALVAGDAPVNLYAVWSNEDAACVHPIQNVTVTLSDALSGKATVELSQKVGGEPRVVATVGGETIQISKGSDSEQVLFSALTIVPDTGYMVDETVNPSYNVGGTGAVEVTSDSPEWAMTDATELSGAVLTIGYTVTFSENAGNTNVFYPADWSETESYNIVDNDGTAFPKLYRTDKCLVGWGFSKDASRAESFDTFNPAFVTAYDSVVAAGVESPVLYGVWNECTQVLYKVTLNDIAEGTLVLSHNGKAYNVPSTGFVVPEATPTLEFGLAFTPNLGYKLNDEGSFNLVDESGVIQSVVEDNMLAVDGDKIVDAPVVTLENTFAFVTNAGNAVLFYGDDWVESATYSLDAQNFNFPKGIYRVDSCLTGWALNTESERTHLVFDTEFLDDVEATRNAGLPVDKLYAIWGACETEQTIVTVANADSLSGTFTLSRTVSQTAKTYTVAGTALQVPADEALAFVVTFVPNNGYTYDETVGITAVDAADAPVSMNADELVVATSLTLSAAATADTYTFALNENAGDANVFYTGSLATEFTAKVIDDAATRAIPMNLYRSDACLEGWNFSATAMAGFSQLDDEFVDAYNEYVAAGNEAPTTLYAVWNEDCRQTLYTVTSYDKRKGSLTLAQGSREFVVDSTGLKVPSVAGGLAFTATFTPAVGYDYDATQGLEAYNSMSQSMGVLTDGALTVTKTTVIKAVSLTASTYELVFNVNAGNATVFYGDAWRAGTEQTSFTLANAGDFPSDIYRTDSCFAGWTLSTSATAGIFTEFTGEFVDSVAAMDNFDGKLFAKWGNCIAVNNVTVAQVTSAAGTLTLKQTDAVGNVLNTIDIDDAEVTLPLGDGDVTFDVSFTLGEGYSLVDGDYFYTVNASGKNVQALLGNKLTLAGNTVLRAPILSDAYTITFNTNAGDANVFYGAGWSSEGQFSMEMNELARMFPTEVYRVGYTLAGWSLTPANNSGDYVFDTELATALKESGKTQVTLYAVWAAAPNQQTYTVTLDDAAAGYLTASQTVGKTTATFRVGEEGLEVPAVTGGLAFDVTATMNAGYFADGEKIYLLAAGGARIDSLASENGELVVDGNKIVEIPYQSDGVEFAFNVNTDARVFYEDGWTGSGAFALNGDTAFPTGILRTEGKLLGWALSRTSTKYYKAYNGTFVNDLKNYKALGLPTDMLYAVWSEYGLFDNVNVTNGNDKNGSFVITQTVNGVETEPITINADGIQIPYSEKGLTFNVKFETKPGYYLNAEEAISGANAAGTSIGNAVNGGALVFKSNTDVVLSASVDANRFKFNYNVNGGDAYVFYGTDWSSTDEKSLNDTSVVFPTNIYRNDACLVGWSIDPADSTGSTLLTSDLIATLDRVQNVNTLYAVWKECEVETYTVTFENTNVGSLVLSQSVDDSLVTFAVEEDGLKVPVVPGGLRFKAAYTLKAGYAGNTDTLFVVDDITGILTTLADNALTVNENITLAIPTVGETFRLVFDVNREGRLFYGSDWMDSAIYMLTDKKSTIPLPNYLYTSDACMVGWSMDSTGGETYLKFNTDLAAALLENKAADSTYRLYAIWGKGADCDDLYDRVTFTGNHGTVHLAEAPRGDKTEFIEHEFMNDGTMILPKTINGNNIRVFAVPDSSYMLDSLVMTREGSDEERQVFIEGDALVFNLMDARFEGFFGKANRTEVKFANAEVLQLGNAIRFVFGTSEFEATRKVAASVRLETIDGELVAADTIIDSIPLPYSGAWDKFPLAAGKYVLTATIGDERGSDEFVETFEVNAEIATVSEESWQIISIANLDKDAMVWDDDDARFYWWDESSASGDYWQYREFNPNDEIVPTRGYWYSSLEGRPLVLKPESDIKVADKVEWKLDSISSGWNLVANPYGFALDIYADHPAENIDQTDATGVTFWRWDANLADYVPAFIVQPYEAVWVKVTAPTDWTIPVAPRFDTDNPDSEFEEDSSDVTLKALAKARRLTKANGKNDWRLQMVLSDAKGHKDSWNMLGASHNAFTTEEPPEGMGDHVKLSIVEGNRMLAKSVKAPADEQDWKIALSANTERYGELSFKGVDDINALGLKVFVTVDGKTTEMHDGMTLRVLLKSSATMATVHVGASAKVVADLRIDGLRSVQAGRSLNVSFDASAELAGTRTVVEILNMDGKVIASRSAKTLAGTNAFAFDAPRGGIYLLRVRAGSQIKAGRIMVR